ncbi:MAG: SDR family oxidoreductase [Phycisphaerales bacterium]|nr:SDR family oxidoreductase [Phycisphaerales bacterium]
MNITLFGSTGSIGRLVLEQLLELGHNVTAFTRNPDNINLTHQLLHPFKGDILDQSDVFNATQGQDVVICTLGMPLLDKSKLRSHGTKNIVDAMNKANVSRLICLSSMGVGDSHTLLPLKYKHVIGPLLMGRLFADHHLQEQHIKQSELDWTIIRPGSFTKGDFTGSYRHGFTVSNKTAKAKISRPDVADFLIQQLDNDTYLHQSPSISY